MQAPEDRFDAWQCTVFAPRGVSAHLKQDAVRVFEAPNLQNIRYDRA
jgi:hypothetical protein